MAVKPLLCKKCFMGQDCGAGILVGLPVQALAAPLKFQLSAIVLGYIAGVGPNA